MGSGKTTALVEWLRGELAEASATALVVSCRRSFTHTLHQRFCDAGLSGFVTYFDASNYIMTGRVFRRLIVQIESLHRVDEELLNNYDVLVLDEVMSTLAQLYSPTMSHLRRVDTLLYRLLRTCPKILAMDATVNVQLVDLLADLRGDRNVHVIINDHAAAGFARRRCVFLRELGTATLARVLGSVAVPPGSGDGSLAGAPELMQWPDVDSFFGRLRERLAAGLNVCVFSSTVIFSELVAAFCLRFTPAVLVLNSARPASAVAEWSAARVLIYTTVITVGISFDSRHFHCMFAYVKPMSHGPDMVSVYQSLGRIRELVYDELSVYLDSGGARTDAVFTPMLLNHVVARHGGWPSTFRRVTDLMCCRFKAACAHAFDPEREPTLFARFKYKHLFERCTLASIADSLNILHALLENNRVTVTLSTCEQPTAAAFCAFVAGLRADALANATALKEIRRTWGPGLSPDAEIADSADISVFAAKYLVADVVPEALEGLLRDLNRPAAREHLVNLAVLGACLRVPAALVSFEVFSHVYRHYATGEIPVVTDTGTLDVVQITPSATYRTRWELYRRCAAMARELRLRLDGTPVRNVSAEEIAAWIAPDEDEYTRWLVELAKCHVTPAVLARRWPVAQTRAALTGGGVARATRPIDPQAHAVAVFKIVWEDLFGMKLTTSTQTFPGTAKVKNLRKDDIISLLRQKRIDPSGCRTHRALYHTLMAHRCLFQERRFKLRPPRWGASLCFTPSGASIVSEAALDAALAAVPPTSWPPSNGALDFSQL